MVERPWWVTNEPEWQADCAAIVQCATDLMEGRGGVIESAWTLVSLAHSVRDGVDPAFRVFSAIHGDSVAFPLGEARQFWNPAALEREDIEIKLFEERWLARAIQAAQHLVNKYRCTALNATSTPKGKQA